MSMSSSVSRAISPLRGNSIPRVPSPVLERPEVDALLAVRASVTVLSGVDGSGKTTAVANWLRKEAGQDAVSWLSLFSDLSDRGLLLDLLRRRLTDAGVLSDGGRTVPVLVALSEALDAREDRRVVIVLDNLQHFADTSLSGDLITLVNSHNNLHLVLITSGPHRFASRAAAECESVVVGISDLRLDADGLERLALMLGHPLRPAERDRLLEELGGWFGPSRLAILAMRQDLDPGHVDDHIREMLSATGEQRRTSAVLARIGLVARVEHEFIAQSADALPAHVVESLARAGLLRKDDDGYEVRMPTTVRRVLTEDLWTQQPDQARDFHRRLADWYAGRPGLDAAMEAFTHACIADDIAQVKRLWAENVISLFGRYPARLAAAIALLPAERIMQSPSLAYTLAMTRAMPEAPAPESDRRVLGTLGALADLTGERVTELPEADALFLGTGHMIRLRLAGRVREAIEFGEKIAARIGHSRRHETLLAQFEMQHALSWTLAGEPERASGLYESAWRTASGHPTYVAPNSAANLSLLHTMRGEPTKAGLWLDRHRRDSREEWWGGPLTAAGALIAEGMRALDRLDEGGARSAVQELEPRIPDLELWPFAVYLVVLTELHFGCPEIAAARLDGVVQRQRPMPGSTAKTLTGVLRVKTHLARGDVRAAMAAARAMPAQTPQSFIARARVELLAGRSAQAASAARRASSAGELTERERLDAMLIAYAAAARDEEPRARRDGLAEQIRVLLGRTGAWRALRAVPEALITDLAIPDVIGEAYTSARDVYPDSVDYVALTDREKELVRSLAEGLSRIDIARRHSVSINTVKTQFSALYRKLGVADRATALERAASAGYLDDRG